MGLLGAQGPGRPQLDPMEVRPRLLRDPYTQRGRAVRNPRVILHSSTCPSDQRHLLADGVKGSDQTLRAATATATVQRRGQGTPTDRGNISM